MGSTGRSGTESRRHDRPSHQAGCDDRRQFPVDDRLTVTILGPNVKPSRNRTVVPVSENIGIAPCVRNQTFW